MKVPARLRTVWAVTTTLPHSVVHLDGAVVEVEAELGVAVADLDGAALSGCFGLPEGSTVFDGVGEGLVEPIERRDRIGGVRSA